MLANLAVGFLEGNSIAKGIEAADAMCKMASVKLAKTAANTITSRPFRLRATRSADLR